MRTLKLIILSALVSICVRSNAQSVNLHGLTPITQKDCQQELVDAVTSCVAWMDQAESLQKSLEGELNTQRALTQAEKADKEFYQRRLEDANSWWRQPAFVIPTTILLTLFGAYKLKP